MPAAPITLASTLGDINGIGPEVCLKAAASPKRPAGVRLVLVGDETALAAAAKTARITAPPPWQPGQPWPRGAATVVWNPGGVRPPRLAPGKIRADASRAAMHWVEQAVIACEMGIFDGLVTAPVCKEGLKAALIDAPGHTEFIAALCGASRYAMVLRGGGLTVALATRHIPLKAVAGAVTAASIRDAALPLHHLLRDLGVERPRIAVCGLNPHAGDGGAIGEEDRLVIAPAIRALRRAGLDASGPHAADTVFWHARAGRFDGVVAMYHDQGLAPLKLVGFEDGVNITAGLRIVRTSPDHGTAFDIAGRNRANPSSMLAAIHTARQLARRRRAP